MELYLITTSFNHCLDCCHTDDEDICIVDSIKKAKIVMIDILKKWHFHGMEEEKIRWFNDGLGVSYYYCEPTILATKFILNGGVD